MVLSDLSNGIFKLAQITSTDRRDKLIGLWITKNSSEGKQMGLLTDSFINLSNTVNVKKFVIVKYIGSCPLMDEIEALCKANGIDLLD